MSKNDFLSAIESFSLNDKIFLIEEILKSIKEDSKKTLPNVESAMFSGKSLVELSGISSGTEIKNYESAVEESRKIDLNEW